MTITVVTHESVPHHRGWCIDQVHRVLDKLDRERTEDLLVRLDPGLALDTAESLALRGQDLTVVPAQANWLPLHKAYERHDSGHRLTALTTAGDHVHVRFLPLEEGTKRVAYQARDVHLAAVGDTHVVVYDERDRGSVLRFLQLVLGTQPVIVINPTDRTVHAAHVHEVTDVPVAAPVPAA